MGVKCLVLIALAAPLCAAAQSSPWYVGGGLTVQHDSNLLRLGRTQPAPGGQSKSDTVTSTSLVGGLDQPIGRQRVTGSVSLRDNRFDHNEQYNNQSYNGSLGLQWSSIERLSGSVSAGLSRNLSTFNADGVGVLASRNYETVRGINASASVGGVTPWSLELTGGRREVRNSLDDPRVLARDYDQNDASVGLAWRPTNAFNAGLSVRELHGAFPRFSRDDQGAEQADLFRQRQFEWFTLLQASGASTIDLRLSTGRTRYQSTSSRDFDGSGGSITWAWQPTGHLRLNTRYSRDEGRDNYPDSVTRLVTCPPALPFPPCFARFPFTITDRRTIDSLRVQVDWDVSAKVALSSSAQYSRRDVDRQRLFANGSLAAADESGIDNTSILTLGARWTPWRSAVVGCELRREERRAGGTITTGLQGTSFTCYGQITLQ